MLTLDKKDTLIVIKVGTSSITCSDGTLNKESMVDIARQIAALRRDGAQVVLVTSGAVGAGIGRMQLDKRPESISKKQALAAIGQGILMGTYEEIYSLYEITVAQLLLCRDDFADKERYLNAHNTILELLRYKALPVINENDTVTYEELKFGDNDKLAALVAELLSADLLLILSDVDGLYTADPHNDDQAQLITEVKEINADIRRLAGCAGSKFASGGMISKVEAAELAGKCGIPTVIARSDSRDILLQVAEGKARATVFLPAAAPLKGKKG